MNNIDKKNTANDHQDHPRHEGQENNIPPIHHRDGQRRSTNNSQSMDNMMQDSEEQKASRGHEQKDPQDTQRDQH